MTSISDVRAYVLGQATQDEVRELWDCLTARRDRLAQAARRELSPGDRVTFTHRYLDYEGVVKSIKIKKATVECSVTNRPGPLTTYNVPLSMLKRAS